MAPSFGSSHCSDASNLLLATLTVLPPPDPSDSSSADPSIATWIGIATGRNVTWIAIESETGYDGDCAIDARKEDGEKRRRVVVVVRWTDSWKVDGTKDASERRRMEVPVRRTDGCVCECWCDHCDEVREMVVQNGGHRWFPGVWGKKWMRSCYEYSDAPMAGAANENF